MTFTVPAGLRITGRVVDDAGHPVPRAPIRAESETVLKRRPGRRCGNVPGPTARVETGADGAFELRHLTAEPWHLSAARGASTPLSVTPASSTSTRVSSTSTGRRGSSSTSRATLRP